MPAGIRSVRRRRAGIGAAALLLLFGIAVPSAATQSDRRNYVEVRAAYSGAGWYRYVESTHEFRAGPVVDLIYAGVPGQNELYVGIGYPLHPTGKLTLTPLIYVVLGKENSQRGVAFAPFLTGSVRNWNIYSFLSYFEPICGNVPRYLSLDTLDVSRRVHERWELGGSAGFVYAAGTWTQLAGLAIIRNDDRGTWRFYVRGGSNLELRMGRTFTF